MSPTFSSISNFTVFCVHIGLHNHFLFAILAFTYSLGHILFIPNLFVPPSPLPFLVNPLPALLCRHLLVSYFLLRFHPLPLLHSLLPQFPLTPSLWSLFHPLTSYFLIFLQFFYFPHLRHSSPSFPSFPSIPLNLVAILLQLFLRFLFFHLFPDSVECKIASDSPRTPPFSQRCSSSA